MREIHRRRFIPTVRDIEIALTTSEITDSAGRNVSQYYDSKIDIFSIMKSMAVSMNHRL